MLERGGEYPSGTFPANYQDLVTATRFTKAGRDSAINVATGLFDIKLSADMNALVANGLGGGSLINAAVMEAPHRSIYEKSAVAHAYPWARFAAACRSTKALLGVSKVREARSLSAEKGFSASAAPPLAPLKFTALKEVAKAIGPGARFRAARIGVNLERRKIIAGQEHLACVQCGDCFTGCNYGAKPSLDRTLLAQARAQGVVIVTGCKVLRVARTRTMGLGHGVLWDVVCVPTDGDEATAKTAQRSIRARRVILAAGTFGSTEILMRSASDTLSFSPRLGERFSGNGDLILASYGMNLPVNAYSEASEPPSYRRVGPTITGMIDLRDRITGEGIVIQEMAAPSALSRLFSEVLINVNFLGSLTQKAEDNLDVDHGANDQAAAQPHQLKRSILYAVMANGPSEGRLKFESGHVSVSWPELRSNATTTETLASLAPLHKAHEHPTVGGALLHNPVWQTLPPLLSKVFGQQDAGPLLTVHPLGGCVAASSPDAGVVDLHGAVYVNHDPDATGQAPPAALLTDDSLIILDGSTIDASLGINPCLTIAALARLRIEHHIRQWGLIEGPTVSNAAKREVPLAPVNLNAMLRDPREPLGNLAQTSIEINERMLGKGIRFVEFEAPLNVALELRLGPVPNLIHWINDPKRAVQIQAGRLSVTHPPDGSVRRAQSSWVPVSGQVDILHIKQKSRARRTAHSVIAFMLNRGLRDFSFKNMAGGNFLTNLMRMSSHFGTIRELRYRLTVDKDLWHDGRLVLKRGDRMLGLKTVEYGWRANLWKQLTTLSLSLASDQPRQTARPMGELHTDPTYFSRYQILLLRLSQRAGLLHAVTDVLSFLTFTVRAIGRIHLMSLRRPDAPDDPVDPDYLSMRPGRLRKGLQVPAGEDLERIRIPIESKAGASPSEVAITVYRPIRPSGAVPESADSQICVLLHGFGASGCTFTLTEIPVNLAESLLDIHRTVWVTDLRSSFANPSSGHPWTLDEVAEQDVVAVIERAWRDNGQRPVDVVAHCIGAALFSMAVMQGRLKGKVRRAVFSQVGLAIQLSPFNQARGQVANLMRNFIPNYRVSAAIDPNSKSLLATLDRLLATFAYPKEESRWHYPLWPTPPSSRIFEATYHRISWIYGPLFHRKNLNQETLEMLDRQIRSIHLRTFAQTTYYATLRRLSNRVGHSLVSRSAIHHIDFPVLFLMGRENAVFDHDGAEESLRLMQRAGNVFADQSQAVTVAGYGHQDCMLGKFAHTAIFPTITDFLRLENRPPKAAPTSQKQYSIYAPSAGPVLGWLRLVGSNLQGARSAPGTRLLRINLASEPVATKPLAVLVVLEGQAGMGRPDTEYDGRIYPLKDSLGQLDWMSIDIIIPARFEKVSGRLVFLYDNEAMDELSHPVSNPQPLGLELLEAFQKEQAGTAAPGVTQFPANPPGANDEWAFEIANQSCIPLDNQQTQAWQRVLTTLSDCGLGRQMAHPLLSRLGFGPDMDDQFEDGKFELSRGALQATDRTGPAHVAGQDSTTPRHAAFIIASCQYTSTMLDAHVAGKVFEEMTQANATAAQGQGFDFALFIGDIIYVEGAGLTLREQTDPTAFAAPYQDLYAMPAAREMMRAIPNYIMLDDHEILNDWRYPANGEDEKAFKAYWEYGHSLNPSAANFESLTRREQLRQTGKPLWFTLHPRGYSVFVLDTRTERYPGAGGEPSSAIISDAQFEALRDWLLKQPPEQPKFIASPASFLPELDGADGSADDWSSYPESMEKMCALLFELQLPRVCIIGGDSHFSCVTDVEISDLKSKNFYRFQSVIASGLYAAVEFANTQPRDITMQRSGIPLAGEKVMRYQVREKSVVNPGGFTKIEITADGHVSIEAIASL